MLLDYLVIGHATRDLKGSIERLGGTAAYAARTARSLGCRVGVVTSVDAHLDLGEHLEEILITRLAAPTSTTFENVYTEVGRQQVLHSVAGPLGPAAIPTHWDAKLVHIGPVAQECDPALVHAFPRAFVGVTPQGWMRQWDETGSVRRCPWEQARLVLPYTDAVVLSEEDLGGGSSVLDDYARETRCLAVTQGAGGCTVYANGDIRHFPAPRVDEVDPTGAGDVFAAAFFYALRHGHDAWTAARFANCVAAQSVTRPGLLGTPREPESAHFRRVTLMGEGDDGHRLCAG